jgi:membrane protein DedA with SNARE-associated domain
MPNALYGYRDHNVAERQNDVFSGSVSPDWSLMLPFGYLSGSLSLRLLMILVGTFILEDGATILTAIAASDGQVPVTSALGTLWIGIVVGDAGLYGLGRLAALSPLFKRWRPSVDHAPGEKRWWHGSRLFRMVFISRFIPGTRLPFYTATGFFSAGFWVFVSATAVATLIWTTALFGLSLRVGHLLLEWMGPWRWLGVAGMVLTTFLIGRFVMRKHKLSSQMGTI